MGAPFLAGFARSGDFRLVISKNQVGTAPSAVQGEVEESSGPELSRRFDFSLLSFLRWVPDVQYLDRIILDSVRHDVRQSLMQQLASPFNNSWSSAMWELLERIDSLAQSNYGRPGKMRFVKAEVVINLF